MKRSIMVLTLFAASLLVTTQSAMGAPACDPSDTGKATICHVPPGNPDNPQTLCVGVAAVPAHLANHAGDHLGACAGNPCGDGTCDANIGEDCGTCEADCGACPTCGDGTCDANIGENCSTCEADCGPCGCCDVGTSHCFVCDPTGAANPDCEGNTCVPASTCEVTDIGRCSNPT